MTIQQLLLQRRGGISICAKTPLNSLIFGTYCGQELLLREAIEEEEEGEAVVFSCDWDSKSF